VLSGHDGIKWAWFADVTTCRRWCRENIKRPQGACRSVSNMRNSIAITRGSKQCNFNNIEIVELFSA